MRDSRATGRSREKAQMQEMSPKNGNRAFFYLFYTHFMDVGSIIPFYFRAIRATRPTRHRNNSSRYKLQFEPHQKKKECQ